MIRTTKTRYALLAFAVATLLTFLVIVPIAIRADDGGGDTGGGADASGSTDSANGGEGSTDSANGGSGSTDSSNAGMGSTDSSNAGLGSTESSNAGLGSTESNGGGVGSTDTGSAGLGSTESGSSGGFFGVVGGIVGGGESSGGVSASTPPPAPVPPPTQTQPTPPPPAYTVTPAPTSTVIAFVQQPVSITNTNTNVSASNSSANATTGSISNTNNSSTGPITISNSVHVTPQQTYQYVQAPPIYFSQSGVYNYPTSASIPPPVYVPSSYSAPAPAYIAPVYTQPTAPAVALTQIPYTGFDFGPIGDTMYWLGLLGFASALSYLALYYRQGAVAFALSFVGERRPAPIRPVAKIVTGQTAETEDIAEEEASVSVLELPVIEARRTTTDSIVIDRSYGVPRIVIARA
jgi:hypothetical protein